jgi:hypothetical protein
VDPARGERKKDFVFEVQPRVQRDLTFAFPLSLPLPLPLPVSVSEFFSPLFLLEQPPRFSNPEGIVEREPSGVLKGNPAGILKGPAGVRLQEGSWRGGLLLVGYQPPSVLAGSPPYPLLVLGPDRIIEGRQPGASPSVLPREKSRLLLSLLWSPSGSR